MHVRSVKKSSTFVVICTVELAQIDDFWEIYYEHEFVFFFFLRSIYAEFCWVSLLGIVTV